MKVTSWYIRHKEKEGYSYRFNHISDGHSTDKAPTATSEWQRQKWNKQVWLKSHDELVNQRIER